jgi:hypothetical protein
MKAVVHVGMPKTGTTSIQEWLLANAGALAQAGIAYDPMPVPGLPQVTSQLEIGFCQFERCGELIPDDATRANYQLDQPGRQAELARQYEEVFAAAVARARQAGCHTFAISSEHLGAWCWKPHHAQALDGWLAQFFAERRYVIYIRRQEDWLLSLYSQHVKNGGTETLQEFIAAYGKTHFLLKARVFAEAVGRENLMLRLMDRDAMKDGDLYADFAETLGVDASDFARPDVQNPSLSMQTAEFLRLMNGYFRPRVDNNSRRNPLFHGVPEFLERISVKGRKLALTPEQVAEVRALNAAQNETLRAEFFPDRPVLFPPKEAAADAGADPSAEDLALVGIQLYRATQMGVVPGLSEADRDSVEPKRRAARPPES